MCIACIIICVGLEHPFRCSFMLVHKDFIVFDALFVPATSYCTQHMYLKTPRCLKCFVFILQDLSACVRGWFTSTGAKAVLTLRNSGLNILLQLKHVSMRAFKKQCLGEFEKIEERFSTA